MRILYNSKDEYHKTPFGCLRCGESCKLRIKIPADCRTVSVRLCIYAENGFEMLVPFEKTGESDGYEIYFSEFSLFARGLYFYYFKIRTENEEFDLFKQGNDTNIADGDVWQVTCYADEYDTPSEFKGRVMYQIFPDRFARSEKCNATGKLEPFFIHENVNETPVYAPNDEGEILNNDFFGGSLNGIKDKLSYLNGLGVGIIYLNPIFFAYSNHRYDTADYKKIDPLLGDEKDFSALCDEAHRLGMKIILDGVFSHTGSNSVYFDKEHIFGNGAYSNENSPYRQWYMFQKYPDEYTSWWGIETLPCVDEMNGDYMDYVIFSPDSVIAHWLRLGADGFRLDVADELPDDFIYALKKRMKEIKENSLLIGEVWEDASNKISYGSRRKYFSYSELDSVMNYPFKDAILMFVKGKISGKEFENRIMTVLENYPKPVVDCLMNLLSTHDTRRVLTEISDIGFDMSKEEKAKFLLSGDDLKRATELEKAAVLLQFTLPGNPCIYYGDEIGMEGYEDPLNRRFFDWSRADCELKGFYGELARLKNENKVLKSGSFRFLKVSESYIKYQRFIGSEAVTAEIFVGGKLEKRENSLVEFFGEHVSATLYTECVQ